MHLVKWLIVSMEKSKKKEKKEGEGVQLGVRRLSLLNKALLCKWNWRYPTKREAFWNQVINGKYGGGRGRRMVL